MKQTDSHLQPPGWDLALTQRTDLALILIDRSGVIIRWSAGAEQVCYYSESQAINKNISFIFPEIAIRLNQPNFFSEIVCAAGQLKLHSNGIRPDGLGFPATLALAPVFDQQRIVTGHSVLISVINDSAIAHTEYGENSTLTPSHEVVNNFPNYAIFTFDVNGIILFWNTGAVRLTRYTSQEIVGQHFSKLYLPESIQDDMPLFDLNKTRADGYSESESWRIAKDGYIFWSHTTLAPIYNHNQEITGFTAILRDITERRLLEKSLRDSEERYRLLVEDVAGYSIIFLDPNGYIKTWNKGAIKLNGYRQEEVIGRYYSIFFTPEAIEARIPALELEKALRDGYSSFECWWKRRDGSLFWGEVVITPLRNPENQLVGFSKIARDITNRKQTQEELEKSNKQLTLVNRDLDNFVYVASHDLKAPILNIEGLVTLLQVEKNLETAEANDLLQMIQQSIASFKNTIEDLTDISSIQKKFSLESFEKIEWSELLEQVKVSLKSEIANTHTVIRSDFSRVPFIYYTRKNLRSILYNLISNAIKYRSPDRAPDIYIKTELKTGDYVLLTIQDNGLGIEEEHKEQAFSIFKRVHNHVEGRGLGLYLVKKIMDNSEGIINMLSEKNQGTTFRLYFKLPDAVS